MDLEEVCYGTQELVLGCKVLVMGNNHNDDMG